MEPPCLADELSDRRQRTAGAGYTPAGASMGEDSNIGIAEALSDHREHRAAEPSQRPWQRLAVIIEAAFLAIVAIATAWSGYQAAKWDGRQAELYGEASTIRIQADELVTIGGQQRLLDVSTFNTWIQARNEGRERLAALYVSRFSPEFKVAFDAWLETKPRRLGRASCPNTTMPRCRRASRRTSAPAVSLTKAPRRADSPTTTFGPPSCSPPCSSYSRRHIASGYAPRGSDYS